MVNGVGWTNYFLPLDVQMSGVLARPVCVIGSWSVVALNALLLVWAGKDWHAGGFRLVLGRMWLALVRLVLGLKRMGMTFRGPGDLLTMSGRYYNYDELGNRYDRAEYAERMHTKSNRQR